MAETKVSKGISKMAAIEEKYVSDMSTYQDLPKPDCNGTNHHNQASDLDNSYVFVSGSDGVTEDVSNDVAAGVMDQEDELEFQPLNEGKCIIEDVVEAEGSSVTSVLPESDATELKDQEAKLHSQIENIDARSQPLNETENCIVEQSNWESSLVNIDNKDMETGSSVPHEPDSALVKEQVAELDPQFLLNNNKDVEAEVSSVVFESNAVEIKDQGAELGSHNERFDAVESINVEQINEYPTPVNDSTSKHESFLENVEGVQVSLDDPLVETAGETNTETEVKDEVEKALDQNGIVEDVAEDEKENRDNVSKEDSSPVPVENQVSEVVSHDIILSETKTEASIQIQSEISEVETVEAAPIVSPKSQITENLSPSYDSGIGCPDEVVLTEKEPAPQGDEAHAETEVSSDKVETAVCPPVVKPDIEGENDDTAVSCRTEASDSLNVNKEATIVMLNVEDTEDIRDPLDGATDSGNENLFVQENEDTENSQCSKVYVASAEGSSVNTIDEKVQIVKIKTKPFNFLVRVPRFDDENLREQIRVAKIHVDEKTKLREAVQIQIQEKRANSQVHGIDYEYAKSEARSARKLVRSKRMEIDSLQVVINKAKNALSIEDIDSQIYNMEHMIQHETLILKEEKQLIREIKQLKQLREQLSSNMGSQDEIKQAIEQRGEVEECLKILRKELDVLKNKVLKAEATAAEAEKKYDDENKKVKELQAQFRAADDVRQAAYAQWQNLRKDLSKKSEYCFKYKDDAAVANNYAYSRDTEALYLLCMNQVDNFMELWNTNDEFRREYAKFNTRSTVRRFGTLDGRALGPDEVPPRLPSYADERASRMASRSVKVDLAAQIPSPEVKQENTGFDDKAKKKATESNYEKVTKEVAITVQVQANGLDIHSVEVHKEPVKSKDEIESLRREEEKRREEAEDKLKEQRRVEALVKANEARERKKRQAEKLQMRADLKTQKEAEQREKEREKRLRKKERKKSGVTVTDGNDMKSINCESGPSYESAAESSKDIEVVNESVVSKKLAPQKPWLLGRQSKGKSIPPPLRNRNKKKLQQWMWVGVTSVMILVLFWLGNIGVFSNIALKRRGPVL